MKKYINQQPFNHTDYGLNLQYCFPVQDNIVFWGMLNDDSYGYTIIPHKVILNTGYYIRKSDLACNNDKYEHLIKMSNRELFDAALDAQVPDDYDGCYTKQGSFEQDLYTRLLEQRLKNWLDEK